MSQTPRYVLISSKPISSSIRCHAVSRKTKAHFFGFGIFSYAFGLGVLFGFLLFCVPLPSPAPWSWPHPSPWSWLCGCGFRLRPLGRAVLLSGSLSESEELSEDDSSLDSPASRGAWYMQHTSICQPGLCQRRRRIEHAMRKTETGAR